MLTRKEIISYFVTELGGTPTADTEKGLLMEILQAMNPLWKLDLDVNISADTDLLGKTIGDLQENVRIDEDVIHGKLFYVDDYTGFSGDVTLQKGYYLVVHASVPNETGVTIVASKPDGTNVTLDADGILIFRVMDTKAASLTFTASKDGKTSASKTYRLSGLTI